MKNYFIATIALLILCTGCVVKDEHYRPARDRERVVVEPEEEVEVEEHPRHREYVEEKVDIN